MVIFQVLVAIILRKEWKNKLYIEEPYTVMLFNLTNVNVTDR